MIRIEAMWLATEALDMRAGTDTALARVIKVFGAAQPHHAYLFANKRATRMKVLVYDGLGIWLAARRLNRGHFVWTDARGDAAVGLNADQLDALVKGLPWQSFAAGHAIRVTWYPHGRKPACLPGASVSGTLAQMNSPIDLNTLNADQLRALAAQLMTQVAEKDSEIRFKDARNAQLTHEIAVLKRLKFAARSEKYDLEQQSLLDETVEADIAAIEIELAALSSQAKTEPEASKPRRAPLPANLPRVEIRHEPDSTSCACGCELKRIGEDVSEKLDYTPGVFTVERHVRGKWVCAKCETLIQAPVPAQIIDKGIPTAGLLAQVLVAKYGDHRVLRTQPP